MATPPSWQAIAQALGEAAEHAARAVAGELGDGDPMRIDQVAVDALRAHLDAGRWTLVVAATEGEKDRAPMLRGGERLGRGDGPTLDLAVDPVDGTRSAAAGRPGAVVALAAAARGALASPSPMPIYAERLLVGPRAARRPPLHDDPDRTARELIEAFDRPPGDVTVALLDRPRNIPYREALDRLGVRIAWMPDGDVATSVELLRGIGPDAAWGIGGWPEAVVVGAAARAAGGWLACRPWADGAFTGPALDLDRLVASAAAAAFTWVEDEPRSIRFASDGGP